MRLHEFGTFTGLALLSLLGLLILGLLVALVVVLAMRSSRGSAQHGAIEHGATGHEDVAPGQPRTGGSTAAHAILEERYARGEIDTAEFEERRRALGG